MHRSTLQVTRRYVHELGIVTTTCDAMPFFPLRFAILRGPGAGARHSEQHHPPPSSRSIKPTPARVRCLAGCHEFSAVGFKFAGRL